MESITPVPIQTAHPLIEPLFEEWSEALGSNKVPYRHHVYRVFHMAASISGATGEDLDKLALSAAFHDVGIWLDTTFDYLEPSVRRLSTFLRKTGRASWIEETACIIRQHHKIFPWRGPRPLLVEAFRRADWLDVCLMALPTHQSRDFLSVLLKTFPRNGFHFRLVMLSLWWIKRHPLRPLPMFKW